MSTIEIVFSVLFGLLGLSFVAVAIRYPKEVFIDIPLGILKWPIDSFKDHLLFFDSDIEHDNYRTKQKLVIDFKLAEKAILVWSEDQDQLKKEIQEGLESLEEALKIEEFGFKACFPRTIIIPPQTITFYTFHYLVQWLDEQFTSVGMVELPRISYSVYNDPIQLT